MSIHTDKTSSDLLMLDNILQYAPDWIYWKDVNSIHLGCSEQFAIAAGFKNREEMVGKSDYDCAWGNRAAKYNLDDAEVIQSGKAKLNIEDTVLLNNGKEVTVISNKVPLRNSNGEIIGILGIATDITERKNIEKELLQAKIVAEAASQAKSEFLANMSHDIRTPITGILGLVQELIDMADDTLVSIQQPALTRSTESIEKYDSLLNQLIEKMREDGQLLLGATDELLQLLNEILETMRLESGKAPERAESFDLRELVEHNIELMLPGAQHKKLKLSCEIDETVPIYVSGLRHYLDRTLLNLLSNALKFTDKGFIKLKVQLLGKSHSAFRHGEEVKLNILVEDSGIGIPEDKFGTIFEHFSRLTPSYQGLYKGSGLGLYTVQRYIDAMHAKIKVESKVGKGTCFIITLPLTVSDHSDREKKSYRTPKTGKVVVQSALSLEGAKAKGATKTDTAATILIVEDNLLAAKAVKSSINRLYSHCICDTAEDGMQALKMAQENQYDLIFMDIGLPDMEGTEVVKQIRALNNPKRAQVPIVALTGHSNDPEKKKEALDAGMQEIFAKPLSISALESLLQRYVFKPEKTSSIKTHTITDSQKTKQVIDWPKCIEQHGDEDLLQDLLSMLAIDLKTSQETLAKAYAAKDYEALRAELHRVRGGVSYLTLPQLDTALAKFHEAAKTIPQDIQQLDYTYRQLQKAINQFIEVLSKKSS